MASIEFDCGSCGKHYKVPVSTAGRKAKCKSCGNPMQIPEVGTPVDENIELIPVSPPPGPGARSGSRSASRPAAPKQPARPAKPARQASPAASEADDLDPLTALASAAEDEEEVIIEREPAPSHTRSGSQGRSSSSRSGSKRGKKKQSGIPLPLLISGISGSVLIVVIVVVLVIVMGGDDETDGEDTTGTNVASSGGAATAPYSPSPSAYIPPSQREPTEPEREAEEEIEPENNEPDTAAPTFVRRPGPSDKLSDWTIKVERSVEDAARQIPHGGLIFTAPTSWTIKPAPDDSSANQLADTTILSPDKKIKIGVSVGKHPSGKPPEWPVLMRSEATPRGYTDEELIYGKVKSNGGMNEFILVADRVATDVEFGTLMGGYRFAKFGLKGERSDLTPIEVTHYLGTIGDLFVHISVLGEDADPEKLAEAQWIARSVRLMSAQDANDYARTTVLFGDWMKEKGTNVPSLGDLPPVKAAEVVAWDGFSPESEFNQMLAMAGAAGPLRSPYRVAPPAGKLELAATSRLAVRWQPSDDGLWMGMQVHDLGSRWRRVESPVIDSNTAMIAGREMALPAGTETSTFDANGMTVHRFVLPPHPAMDSREVYYVTLDRGVLVTVMGRYAKDRPDDLKLLDAAAKTLNKS